MDLTAKGIGISEIEASLRGATTWAQWRDNLKNNTINGRRKQKEVDQLFKAWDL